MSESRHLRSVSDLYAADEIEVLLLEEIRDLEPPPAAYSRPEDIQDFEIAGSRTGGRISSQSSELDSPGIHSTVHSWDSHANYHGNYAHGDHRHGSSANAMAWPRASHLIFYCDIQGHLKTATGLVRLLLLLSSAACLATLCSSGTAKVSLFMLPLVGRLRFMIFVAVFCLLITALLLFLDISHVVYFFPFNWTRVNAYTFAVIGASYLVSSVLLSFAVFEYHGTGWVPRRTRSQLTATAALGLSCSLFSFALAWLHGRHVSSCHAPQPEDDQTQQLFKPAESSSSGATLKDGPRPGGKQPPPWVAKNSRKHRASLDSSNGGQRRKDHWASARDHFLGSGHFDEEQEEAAAAQAQAQPAGPRQQGVGADKDKDAEPGDGQRERDQRQEQQQRRRQQQQQQRRQRREADGGATSSSNGGGGGGMSASQTKTSFSTDESKSASGGTSGGTSGKKAAPPKKLAIQSADKARPRAGGKDGPAKKPQRTSVTRSEIQEYWMQGYEHVQRTDKTTANIEQWQSSAMKSLEEKKANDARWSELWRQQKEQAQKEALVAALPRSQSQTQPSAEEPAPDRPAAAAAAAAADDHAKPCSSKTLEPLNLV